MLARPTSSHIIRIVASLGVLALFLTAYSQAAPTVPAAPPRQEATSGASKALSAQSGGALGELVGAAKSEGKHNIAGPSSLGDDAVQRLVEAMNKKYAANIEMTWTGADQGGLVVAQNITEINTGGQPTWDIFITNDGQMPKLFTANALEKRPYGDMFGLPIRRVGFDSTVVGFANQRVLAAYNTNLVAAANVPKT